MRKTSVFVCACVALLFAAASVLGESITSDSGREPGGSNGPSRDTGFSKPPRFPSAETTAPRPSARDRAEHRRSRTAYEDVRGSAALRLARQSFGEVFREPVWRGLKPGHGQRVRRYRDDYTAELEDADGTESIATSTLPLRTRDRGGRAVPVDLGIEAADDAYAPRSPLVPTRIAKRARGGVTLGREAIGVRPLGAADATGRLEDDRLFYPDTGTDTDLLIEPHDAGAEVMWQVRSAASPERHSLALDLPAGAKLRPSGRVPGGAEIVRGGKLLALVQPPTAVDADGTSVPATYAIFGETLTVAVPHREASIRYPLLVDPEFNVVEDFFNADWTARTDDGGFGWTAGINGDWNWAAYPWALHVSGKPWAGYAAGQWANWHWYAPRNAYIYRADFLSMTYQAKPSSATANSCPHFGIIAADWERVAGVSNCAVDYPSLALPGLCVDAGCSPSAGTDGNRAVSGLDTRVAGGGNSAFLSLGRAVLYLRDRHRPKVLSTSHSSTLNNAVADGRWLGAGVNLASTPRGTDWGLGIARFDLINRVSERKIPVFGPEGNPRHLWCSFSSPAHDLTPGPSGEPVDPGSDKGDRAHRCVSAQTNPGVTPPDSQTVASTFDYSTDQLDEGIHTYGVDAYDIVGIKNDPPTSGWTLKVDRGGPAITEVSGTLWDARSRGDDHRNEGVYTSTAGLRVVAGDGAASAPATSRSGVKRIDIHIFHPTTGALERESYDPSPQTCPVGNCTKTRDFTLNSDDLPDGDHRVRIAVSDQVGNWTYQNFNVTVDRRGDIYHGTQYTGNPAAGGTLVLEEWAQLASTGAARSVDQDRIQTRDTVPCVDGGPAVPVCEEVRTRSRLAESDATDREAFSITRGTSADDPSLSPVTEMTEEIGNTATPAATGPLTDALQPWQARPPAAGTEYLMYEATETDEEEYVSEIDDGEEVTEPITVTVRVWVDALTRLPLKTTATNQRGETIFEDYWTYEVGRQERTHYSADFFRVPTPAAVSKQTEVYMRGIQAVGPITDRERNSSFTSYYAGTAPAFLSGSFCLGGTDIVYFTPNPSLTIPDPDPTLPPAPPYATETMVASNYTLLQPGEVCVPGDQNPETPDFEVVSHHRLSTAAQAWKDVYFGEANAVDTDPLDEDFAATGTHQVLFNGVHVPAYVLRLDDTRSTALLETGDTSIIVKGDFNRANLQTVVAQLVPR